MRRLLVFAALLVALPAQAVDIEWEYVGNPGNPPDTATNCHGANCGSVDYAYFISKYEITNAQYAEFLNAVAASDPLGLYNTNMGSDANFGGLTRSGVSGSYTYTAKPGFEDKPVVFVSFWDALRFANWLHNGQGSGDTEEGAYTITPDGIASNTITRNQAEAVTFLPSENEWYKAAYCSQGGVYYDYPTGTDAQTECVAPGSDTGNAANCYPHAAGVGVLTSVGAYGLSESPYGTFDQGGNVWEWNEELNEVPMVGSYRGFRGGAWNADVGHLAASYVGDANPTLELNYLGFRVAAVPEPAQVLLVLTGGLVLGAARRKRGA